MSYIKPRTYKQLTPGRELLVEWAKKNTLTGPPGSSRLYWRPAITMRSEHKKLTVFFEDSGGIFTFSSLRKVKAKRLRRARVEAAAPEAPPREATSNGQGPAST